MQEYSRYKEGWRQVMHAVPVREHVSLLSAPPTVVVALVLAVSYKQTAMRRQF